MRWFVHRLLRDHYRFEQGTTEFYICAPRRRWGRATEYTVVMAGLDPVTVTEEQFVNLDQRLRAEGVTTVDELIDDLDEEGPP